MFGLIRRLFSARGGCIGESNPEPCIGCQQAQQRINSGANGEWTQCHMCRCVWAHKSASVGWIEIGSRKHEGIKRPSAEAEALRQDAERYRWLRAQHWSDSPLAVVADPRNAVKPGRDCPSSARLDELIDAEMP